MASFYAKLRVFASWVDGIEDLRFGLWGVLDLRKTGFVGFRAFWVQGLG